MFNNSRQFYYTDWKDNSKGYCDQFWKGWDERFHGNEAVQIKDIGMFTFTK